MDLIDLFIGSEGTLGVIAEAVLRTAPERGPVVRALVQLASEAAALALVEQLRNNADGDYASGNPFGLDVAAIEHMDARSLAVVREDGVDHKLAITIRPGTAVMLLIEIELRPADRGRDLWPEFQDALTEGAPDTPVRRLCQLLDEWNVLDATEIAMPSDEARARAFAELREAVPAGVNRRVAVAQQTIDPLISKTAADMIVPFARFGDMMRDVPPPVRRARPRPRGVGTHLRRQRPSQPDSRQCGRCQERGGGDARAGRRSDQDGRLSDGRARRRPQCRSSRNC